VNSAGAQPYNTFTTLQPQKNQSSLLGTTARQKLLAFKLAKAAKVDSDQIDIEKLDLAVDVKNKTVSSLALGKAPATRNAVDAKRLYRTIRNDPKEKQRLLEAVYAAGAKSDGRAKASMRQTLKANLAKNLRSKGDDSGAQRRVASVAEQDKAAWNQSSDMMAMAARSTDVGSMQ